VPPTHLPLILAAPFKADHRLNGLCIAFAISFPTRSWTDGSDMSAGSVRRSNSRRRSASSLDILLTDLTRPGLFVHLGMEVGRALPPSGSISLRKVMFQT
jgi:hypothetical protein